MKIKIGDLVRYTTSKYYIVVRIEEAEERKDKKDCYKVMCLETGRVYVTIALPSNVISK